jgi:hypothetical protein
VNLALGSPGEQPFGSFADPLVARHNRGQLERVVASGKPWLVAEPAVVDVDEILYAYIFLP